MIRATSRDSGSARHIAVIAALVAAALTTLVPAAVAARAGVDASASERGAVPRGTRVRWGGVIERAAVEGSQVTLLVRGHPLDGSGRPRTESPSGGRFLVVAPERGDSSARAPGRVMTVVGRVAAEVEAPVAGSKQRLPVVRAETRQLWPVPVRTAVSHRGHEYYRDPPYRRHDHHDSIFAIGALAVVGALLLADHSYVSIGVGQHYGYRHHGYRHRGYRGHHRGYRHHRGHRGRRFHGHLGVSGGFRF